MLWLSAAQGSKVAEKIIVRTRWASGGDEAGIHEPAMWTAVGRLLGAC